MYVAVTVVAGDAHTQLLSLSLRDLCGLRCNVNSRPSCSTLVGRTAMPQVVIHAEQSHAFSCSDVLILHLAVTHG